MSRDAPVFDLLSTPIESGVTLIEASAGTGKTYCLAGLVIRLLLEKKIDELGQVLVMTFTNAATAELTERIRSMLCEAVRVFDGAPCDANKYLAELRAVHGSAGAKILRRAVRNLDDLEVCTIHGFCRRVLEQDAFETCAPFDLEYVEDDSSLIDRAAANFWRHTFYPACDLAAAVAMHEGWLPTRFIEDYKACRRHPGIRIEPPALTIEQAIQRLEAGARAVAAAWKPAEFRAFLDSLRFKKEERPSRVEIEMWIEELRAFCEDGRATAVGAVLKTGSDALAASLTESHKRAVGRDPFVAQCDAMALGVVDFEHALRSSFIREADALVRTEKHAAQAAGFDDLLHRLHAALQEPMQRQSLRRSAAARYRAVLVDEFQDTDVIQYEIFRELFEDSILYFIGDPKQAIYGFRGADVFAYIRAKRSAQRSYTLRRNWRSEAALVEATGAVFGRSSLPFVFEAIPYVEVRAAGDADRTPIRGDDRRALEWVWVPKNPNKDKAGNEIRAAIVREITHLLADDVHIGSRRVEPRDIAVLVRVNREAEPLQRDLRCAGVPAVISRGGSVFQSDEAEHLLRLLAAVAHPSDDTAVRAALATRAWGMDAAGITKLSARDQEWQSLIERLEGLRDVWDHRGFVAMAQGLLGLCNARVRLLEREGGTRRLTNLLHLVELVQHAIGERHLSRDGALTWLARMRADQRGQPNEANEIRLETDADAVQIMTVHGSKGLEYGIVFCPSLWDARREDGKAPVLVHVDEEHVVYDCSGSLHEQRVAMREAERVSEDARLAYVAMTRARHRCYVAWGELGSKAALNSALAYLLHEPVSESGSQEAAAIRVSARLEAAAASANRWRENLEKLCAESGDRMSLRDCSSLPKGAGWKAPAGRQRPLAARKFPKRALPQLLQWRVASFSSLSSSTVGSVSGPGAGTVVAGVEREAPDHGDPAKQVSTEDVAGEGILAFARGPRAGTCLHEILERCDFPCVDDDPTARLVTETLTRHGLHRPAAHHAAIDATAAVLGMLDDVTRCELPGAGFSLASVPRTVRLNEWQFYLPMARLSQSSLADAFARHASDTVREAYAPLLATLGDHQTHGFLTGFVDLVFVHQERWYVIDWKSTYLGNSLEDYAQGEIDRVMREHHYVLQYHLYTLALHRYLTQRLADYQYERDLGGVYYGFLRGIRPGAAMGWCFDKPRRALIEALDALFGGQSRA